MTIKGTVLPRREQFKSDRLFGNALVLKMRAKFSRENPAAKGTYQELADAIKQICPDDIEISAQYLIALNSRDQSLSPKKAMVCAKYLNIPVTDIQTSNYGTQKKRHKKKPLEKTTATFLSIQVWKIPNKEVHHGESH